MRGSLIGQKGPVVGLEPGPREIRRGHPGVIAEEITAFDARSVRMGECKPSPTTESTRSRRDKDRGHQKATNGEAIPTLVELIVQDVEGANAVGTPAHHRPPNHGCELPVETTYSQMDPESVLEALNTVVTSSRLQHSVREVELATGTPWVRRGRVGHVGHAVTQERVHYPQVKCS